MDVKASGVTPTCSHFPSALPSESGLAFPICILISGRWMTFTEVGRDGNSGRVHTPVRLRLTFHSMVPMNG